MTCPRCGADVREGFRFCGRCGAALAPAPPSERPATAQRHGDTRGTDAEDRDLAPTTSRWPSPVVIGVAIVLLLAAVVGVRAVGGGPGIVTSGPAAPDRAGTFEAPEIDDLDLVRWRRDRAGRADGLVSTPTVQGGVAFVAASGSLVALDVAGGAPRWRAEVDVLPVAPVVGSGVVIARGENDLVAVDAATGRVTRVVGLRVGAAADGDPDPSPALAGAGPTVLAVAPDGSLFAFDSATLSSRWRMARSVVPGREPLPMTGAIAVGGDRVYAVARGPEGPDVVSAFDVRDGSVVWHATLPPGPATDVLVVGDALIVGVDGQTLVVDAATGVFRDPVPFVTDEFRGAIARAAVGDQGLVVVTEGTRAVLQRRGRRFVVTGQAETALVAQAVAAADDQLAVTHAQDGSVLGVNVATGGVEWASSRVGAVDRASSLTDELVLTPLEGAVIGLDRERGTVRWRTSVTGAGSCPLAGGGEVTFLVGGGRLHAYDAVSGLVRWSYESRAAVVEPGAAGGGRVAVSDEAGVLAVIDARSGLVASRVALPSAAVGPPVVVGDAVFAAGSAQPSSGWVVSVVDDRIRWTQTVGAVFRHPPTVAGGRVLVSSEDGVMHAIDAETGDVLWRTDPGPRPAAPVVATADVVIGRDEHGAVVGRAPGTGIELWRRELETSLAGAPAVAGDLLIVRGSTRTLVALDLRDGEPRWEARVDVALTGPPVVAADRVYVGSETGVVVVDLATGGLADLIERPSATIGSAVVGAAGVTLCQADGSVIALGG